MSRAFLERGDVGVKRRRFRPGQGGRRGEGVLGSMGFLGRRGIEEKFLVIEKRFAVECVHVDFTIGHELCYLRKISSVFYLQSFHNRLLVMRQVSINIQIKGMANGSDIAGSHQTLAFHAHFREQDTRTTGTDKVTKGTQGRNQLFNINSGQVLFGHFARVGLY